jgi:methylated-DNA-protein-cysteine methyltransferase-like protein
VAPVPAFADRVVSVIDAIAPGDVWSYGEVAAAAGRPGAARAVGRLLATSGAETAWWRVVTATGRLVPGHEGEHARLLEAEGVIVDRAAGRVVGIRADAHAHRGD